MANTGNDGTPEPDNEDNNERQQDDEDRRRPIRARLSYDITGEPVVVNEQVLYQPTRPVPAAASVPEKSDALPSNWQDILAERLSKLTDKERADYDHHLDVARQRDENVSPNYRLELATLLNKPLNEVAFGSDLNKLDRREEYRAYVRDRQTLLEAHAHRQQSTEQTRAPSSGDAKLEAAKTTPDSQSERPLQPAPQQPSRPAASHDAAAQRQHPSPRNAAPDRTTLARRRLNHLPHEHAQRRKELNLPLSPAAQNEFARLDSQQEAERKTLVDRHSIAINLLDYQHANEQTAVAYRWLARDLKQRGSPEAAGYEQQSKDLLRAAGRAYEQRQALAAHHADPHGWDRAALSSTYAPPSQTQQGPARSSNAATPSFQPTVAAPPPARDPTAFFKDSSGAVMTVDRLRAMLDRYKELRQNLAMPSGPNEITDQSRLATAQATVRTNLLSQQDAQSQLLAQKHLGERAGTSSQWMAHDTHQLRYRDDARRAFALAKHATARLDAIDPRTAAQDRTRAINNDQVHSRQAADQEAAKGGRTLSAEERANLPTQAARGAREPGKETGARMQGAKPSLPRTGRGGPIARGGGGRGR